MTLGGCGVSLHPAALSSETKAQGWAWVHSEKGAVEGS